MMNSFFQIFRRLCCRGPPPIKPNFTVLCLGLKGAGKSTLLAVLSGESSDEIAPTVGSYKALFITLMVKCIVVKKNTKYCVKPGLTENIAQPHSYITGFTVDS